MAKNLTQKQKEIYQFIQGYILKTHRSPYLREIQQSCGIRSHKIVIDRLTAIERKGYIRRKPNRHRSIRLVNNGKNIKHNIV